MKNRKTFRVFFPNLFLFSVEKSKFANRLKRALPKFRGDWSEVWGVNGRSKFAVAAVRRKTWVYHYSDAALMGDDARCNVEPREFLLLSYVKGLRMPDLRNFNW